MAKTSTPEPEEQPKPSHSFEEFRMMYDSTEQVSTRKVAFTRDNSSLCMAMIAGQGLCANWTAKHPDMLVGVALAIILISGLGIVFCRYWRGQLLSFKDLNTAKFRVLAEMAGQVVFPDYSQTGVRSKNPFTREWDILQEMKRLGDDRGALIQKTTLTEMTVPQSFMVFFFIEGVAAILAIVVFVAGHLNWPLLLQIWRP